MRATEHTHRVGDDRQSPRLVSVVIPVKNGAHVLPTQLAALERQTYRGEWEVLVVDNGSSDDTVAVALQWSSRLPLRIVGAASRAGISHARNRGMETARGDLIAFCDSDDQACPAWLESLVKASRGYDAVEGRLDFEALNQDLVRDVGHPLTRRPLMRHGDFLPYATGANFCVWTDIALNLGGWNESYEYGGDDVEFCFRLQLAGHSLGFSDSAVMHYRLRGDLRSLVRQHFKYGASHVQIYRDFRSEGMARSSLTTAAKSWAWILARWPLITLSRSKRHRWIKICAKRAGRVAASVRYRVLYL